MPLPAVEPMPPRAAGALPWVRAGPAEAQAAGGAVRRPSGDAASAVRERRRRSLPADAHYEGRKLAADVPVATRELVSTFGHGVHACPAQRFAVSAIRIAVARLLERYDVAPEFTTATARSHQLGAVARAAHPCVVTYRRRVSA